MSNDIRGGRELLKYLWVRRADGTYQGAVAEETPGGEGKEARYAVEYLDEDGTPTGEIGLVWQQERNTSVAHFDTLEALQFYAKGSTGTIDDQ